MDKIKEFLNKDVKEFNLKLLIILAVLFLFVVGFISYKVTVNTSYALFTDNVIGTKTITVHYEEKFDNFYDMMRIKANTNQTIDFEQAPSDTNGNGINVLAGTENDTHPIYFYRGFDTEGKKVVDYNNVLFGDFCWKIVRTTDTGGIKLIYNGTPTNDDKCNKPLFSDGGRSQTTTSIYMFSNYTYYYGTNYTFNEATGQYSLAGEITSGVWSNDFVGKYTCKALSSTSSCNTLYYMDSYISTTEASVYLYTTISNKQIGISVFNTNHNSPAYNGYMYGTVYPYDDEAANAGSLFGSSFTYSGGSYTLTSTNDTKDNTHHYTCNNTTGTCTIIRYYYYNNYYIELTGGDGVQQALAKMQTNTTDSTIKTVVDNWYTTNLASYGSYLEDTVWCNDRSMDTSTNGWSENGNISNDLYYGAYVRNRRTFEPSVTCINKNDAFTVNDTTNGNGALNYPVGLLTADELTMAGSGKSGYSTQSYLYTKTKIASLSPLYFNYIGAYIFPLDSLGKLDYNYVSSDFGVRPAVSLKSSVKITSGDGSAGNPFIVEQT